MRNFKNKICILSYSHVSRDARVMRQIRFLSKKYQLSIIGYGIFHPDYPPSNNIDWVEISRGQRTLSRRFSDFLRILRYFFGIVDRPEALRAAIDAKADVYHANNWETLPVAALAAKQNHAHLVFDIHESLKTEGGWLYETLNKWVVNRYVDQIDASTTVVDAIAKDYQEAFGLNPKIIRNIPTLPKSSIEFRETKPENIRLIYHGGAAASRRLDLMIKAVSLCNPAYELHFALTNYDSTIADSLKNLAQEIAPNRVFFQRAFLPEDIVKEISKYDIGFYALPPTVYNNLIALPNKLFEFIAAGLAVCIGPSPSMVKLVKTYRCGVVANDFNPSSLASVLNHTTPKEWDRMKLASLKASKVLNADNEMKTLLSLYNQMEKI